MINRMNYNKKCSRQKQAILQNILFLFTEEHIFSKNCNQGFEISNPSENYICQPSTSLSSQGSEQLNSIYTRLLTLPKFIDILSSVV